MAARATLVPVDELPVPPGDDPKQCVGYGRGKVGQAKARSRYAEVSASMAAALGVNGTQAASFLFNTYLQHGVMSQIRNDVSGMDGMATFKKAEATQTAYTHAVQDAVADIEVDPPRLASRDVPTTRTLKDLHAGTNLVFTYTPTEDADFFQKVSTPALIAGGVSTVDSQRGTFYDSRDITGTVALIPDVTERGVRTRVTAEIFKVKLLIKDSIDFCPGGLGGSAARNVTLPMSRLERTVHPGGGGWTQPVLWGAHVPLADRSVDVTDAYPTNDADGDTWPDEQPYTGADYPLDNCPGVANKGQEDADHDGKGDACDAGAKYLLTFREEYTQDYSASGSTPTGSNSNTFKWHTVYAGSAELTYDEQNASASVDHVQFHNAIDGANNSIDDNSQALCDIEHEYHDTFTENTRIDDPAQYTGQAPPTGLFNLVFYTDEDGTPRLKYPIGGAGGLDLGMDPRYWDVTVTDSDTHVGCFGETTAHTTTSPIYLTPTYAFWAYSPTRPGDLLAPLLGNADGTTYELHVHPAAVVTDVGTAHTVETWSTDVTVTREP